ncbi:MAG: Cell division protein FtsQ [candidate division WS2 bacterium]|nr:Cell division protein FtsQ [Candidatus Lithacetigena glycinireducens]
MWGRASSTAHDSSSARAGERLKKRRRSRRRHLLIALAVFLLIVSGALIWGFWQSAVRISHIQIFGADQSFAAYATNAMQGSYLGMIPRDSTFFFPASRIRANILAAHSDIAAVSIFRDGLTGISIKINDRAPIARWCGSTLDATRLNLGADCYLFDASGVIFAPAATSTQTINTFILYAPLEGTRGGPPVASEIAPLRATIAQAEKLPAAFDFARQLDTLGSPVTHVVLRDDEVDDYLTSGTRITYVLGKEHTAFTALVSARDNLNLTDGSIEYIDLRFDGKVYFKRKK